VSKLSAKVFLKVN